MCVSPVQITGKNMEATMLVNPTPEPNSKIYDPLGMESW